MPEKTRSNERRSQRADPEVGSPSREAELAVPAGSRPAAANRIANSDDRLERLAPDALKPNPRNARAHSSGQIARIAGSISAFGFIAPVLIDENGMILAGHGRWEAAKRLGLAAIPCRRVNALSTEQKRAYALADNRLGLDAWWNRRRLAEELEDLSGLDLDFDIEATGFSIPEIDCIIEGPGPREPLDREEDRPGPDGPPRVKPGDFWRLGRHRLACGDGRDRGVIVYLTDGEQAKAAFCDLRAGPPERGAICASPPELFFNKALQNLADCSADGAIQFIAGDWRRMGEIVAAGAEVYGALSDLVVWAKPAGGEKSRDRRPDGAHELLFVYRARTAGGARAAWTPGPERRGNLWTYRPVPKRTAGRQDARADECAGGRDIIPVRMISGAIEDATRPGDVVLDLFAGDGAALIAAEKTRRRAFVAEADPEKCDRIIRRWEAYAGATAERAPHYDRAASPWESAA